MKKALIFLALLLTLMSSAMAKQAHIMVVPSDPKTGVVEEDDAALKACPLLSGGVVNYKDEQDLSDKISAIEEYFAQNPLQKRYSLKFMDSKTMMAVGEVTVGGGKSVSITGEKNKDQLVMGIGAAILAVILLALSAFMRRSKKAQGLAKAISAIFLILGLFSGLLAIVWTVSLGIKMLMYVCGPAILIGAAILLLAGSAKGGKSRQADAAPKVSQTPHGYSVNGKHFDNWGDAALYVKQFSYMDNSWITPE